MTSLQKVSCLCLLDLSATFDTIDHNVLITRLSSWFGMALRIQPYRTKIWYGFVLSWFKSSRSFCVKCDNNLSSFHPSSCGVPQAKSLFSALYSSSCTLPLSVLWSLSFLLTTTFTQMTLLFFPVSTHSTLTRAFLTFKPLFNRSLPGWLLIFLLLTPLRLNCCSSDSTICQNAQLFTWHLALCSKSWLYLWRTSYLLW